MTSMTDDFVQQLDEILADYEQWRDDADSSSADMFLGRRLQTSALAAINRIAGPDSTYASESRAPQGHAFEVQLEHIVAIASALRGDLQRGYLTSARELLHAEVFSDFLDMAEHLGAEGYKDAAAVMGGGVLETHLRALAVKNGISLETTNAKGETIPKRAEALNEDLGRLKVYNRNEQKQVTAWLGLRNDAAHAHYANYTLELVNTFTLGLRGFLARYPA